MEKWIEQTIQSCLQQKDIHSEIIVIDDGSTDNSLSIIQRFGNSLRWESVGKNQGVNVARNRGLSMASGEFVLFLDADDYLAQDTLCQQVDLMVAQSADLCYGDWKYWVVGKNGADRSEHHNRKRKRGDDLTTSLLKDWWCPPFAYLYRKQFLSENEIFWNESLGFPDDFEYILKVSLKQPFVVDLPTVTGYYRRHAGVRLSEINPEQWMKNVIFIYEFTENQLRAQNRWTEPYIDALCSGYLEVGRRMYACNPIHFEKMLDKIHQLKPNFQASRKRYRWAARLLGYEWAERLAQFKRRGRRAIEEFLHKASGK